MSEKKYTEDHEWVSLQDQIATVGISNHAQESLGDIVFVDLPSTGKLVKEKEEICVIESIKAASDIYAPLSGEVIEINEILIDEPEIVNESPLKDGWFYKIKVANIEEFDVLMREDEYQASCEEE